MTNLAGIPASARAPGVNLPNPGLLCVLWVGLSLSIGWGIRGNFGHEYGSMIPGALASLAAALLSGRSDWHRRAVFFAFFGAPASKVPQPSNNPSKPHTRLRWFFMANRSFLEEE